MMGLTCHKPHKRHGSLLNRVPLMYTSASLKRSGESVYHLWIATKNAFASSLYVRRTMIAVHPRRYIPAEYGDSCCIIWIFSSAAVIALQKFCGLVTKSMFYPFLSKRSEACAFAFWKNPPKFVESRLYYYERINGYFHFAKPISRSWYQNFNHIPRVRQEDRFGILKFSYTFVLLFKFGQHTTWLNLE